MTMERPDLIPAWVDGKLTPIEKMKVHREGLRHQAVSVFVMNRDKVLVQRRALSKYHTPGLWANTCCTHPLWNEPPEACAIRRLREELGITGLFPSFRDQVEYRADVGGGLTEHEVVDIFLVDAGPDLVIEPNPDEVMEVRWMSFYDLAADVTRSPDKYTAWLQIYLNEHTEKIFGTLVQA